MSNDNKNTKSTVSAAVNLVPDLTVTQTGGFHVDGNVQIGTGNSNGLTIIPGTNYEMDFNNETGCALYLGSNGHTTLGGLGMDFFTNSGDPIVFNSPIRLGNTGPTIQHGNGNPEGVKIGQKGSLYLRMDGSPGTFFYVKESGDYPGDTIGWVAK